MNAVSAELIAKIARKLFVKQTSNSTTVRESGDFLLDPDELIKGIGNLLQSGDLKLGAATEPEDFTDALVDKVIDVVTSLQNGVPGLKTDGILGKMTLGFLLRRPFGHFNRPNESLPRSTTRSEPGKDGNAVRYFFDTELPQVQGKKPKEILQLFREATFSWKGVCNVDLKHADKREEANIIVKTRRLTDQPDSVLAIADVGPPRGAQLELVFDEGELWTPNTFLATCAHEFGHNLGLHHISTPNQLMNDTLHDEIFTPKRDDANEAVRIWGPPK